MSKRLVVVLLVAIAGNAQAEWKEWDKDGEKTIYIDLESIKYSDSIAAFWTLMDHRKPQQRNGFTILSSRARNLAECTNGWIKLTSLYTYAGNMGQGKEISSEIINMEWQPVLPGSGADSYLNLVCTAWKAKE